MCSLNRTLATLGTLKLKSSFLQAYMLHEKGRNCVLTEVPSDQSSLITELIYFTHAKYFTISLRPHKATVLHVLLSF